MYRYLENNLQKFKTLLIWRLQKQGLILYYL